MRWAWIGTGYALLAAVALWLWCLFHGLLHKLGWFLPAAACLVLVAGCGGDDPVSPPPDPLAAMYGTYTGTLHSQAGSTGFMDPMVLTITGGPNVAVTLSGDQLTVTSRTVTATNVTATCKYGTITFSLSGTRSGATISGSMGSGPSGGWPGSTGSFQVTRGRSALPALNSPHLMDQLDE